MGNNQISILPTNFAKVDDRVWRGARPDADQARWLYGEGVRTMLNLEWEASDGPALGGMDILRINIKDFEPLPYFFPSLADDHGAVDVAELTVPEPLHEGHGRKACCTNWTVVADDPIPALCSISRQ